MKIGIRASAGAQKGPTGSLAAVGNVKVNGKPAVSGDIIESGSIILTSKAARSVVSLGKLGRVEISESSTMKLSFAASIIIIFLGRGHAKVSAAKATAVTVLIKSGEVVVAGRR